MHVSIFVGVCEFDNMFLCMHVSVSVCLRVEEVEIIRIERVRERITFSHEKDISNVSIYFSG